MRSALIWLGTGAVVVITVGGWTFMQSSGAQTSRLDPSNAETVALGERLYKEHCASCHGAELKGQPNWKRPLPKGGLPAPPHDETGHTWHHADQVLFDYTKKGGQEIAGAGFKSKMPAFRDSLSDDEIWAVLSYIKSRWPLVYQKRHDEQNDNAK